jgi:hypothetical protein
MPMLPRSPRRTPGWLYGKRLVPPDTRQSFSGTDSRDLRFFQLSLPGSLVFCAVFQDYSLIMLCIVYHKRLKVSSYWKAS